MMETLIVICDCDQPPIAPFDGHRLKTYQFFKAVAGTMNVHCLIYADGPKIKAAVEKQWENTGIQFHYLMPRRSGAITRSIFSGLSLPTSRRDFLKEKEIIDKIVELNPRTRIFVDYLSGAPVVRYYQQGAIISAHDCMSLYHREEAKYLPFGKKKITEWVRAWHARNAEKRYYHQASAVHVVSQKDADYVTKVNPRAKISVIPLSVTIGPDQKINPDRSEKLIWFNAKLGTQVFGVRKLLKASPPGFFNDWTFLGRGKFDDVVKRIPEIAPYKSQFQGYVEDLEELLNRTKAVIIPDYSGAGQKTRVLHAMLHGCCVIGFPEAFRDLPGTNEAEFVCFTSDDSIALKLDKLGNLPLTDIASAGKKMVLLHYSTETVRKKWIQFLNENPYVRR
jgi:glycosyltransferase involved in cell wall biosynthesis